MSLIVSPEEVLGKINGLNVWRRGDERAPHKPLLVLLALARVSVGARRLAPYADWERPLRALLEEFGPARQSIHPEYPFWRLKNDGIWEVEERVGLTRRRGNSDPLKSELISFSIRGGFTEPVYEAFRRDPLLCRQAALALLSGHFPASLHEEILAAGGLELETGLKRARFSRFRCEVLETYGHACAFCGYSVRIGNADLALDAAHIMWHQAKGPAIAANGLACCSLHHRALDRGAIGISEDRRILVSSSVHGGPMLDEYFLSLAGKPLRTPNRIEDAPREEFLQWHRREVFRRPPRS